MPSERIEKCQTCTWWDADEHDRKQNFGQHACRRHAPILMPEMCSRCSSHDGEWPWTSSLSFCGDWEEAPDASV